MNCRGRKPIRKKIELGDSDRLKSIGSSSKKKRDSFKFLKFDEVTSFLKPVNLKLGMFFLLQSTCLERL